MTFKDASQFVPNTPGPVEGGLVLMEYDHGVRHVAVVVGVYDRVGLQGMFGQPGRRAYVFNAVVADKNRGVAQLGAGMVLDGNGVGLVNQQSAHGRVQSFGLPKNRGRIPLKR